MVAFRFCRFCGRILTMEENKSLQLKLRKNKSLLVSAGTGIILLCVWSVIKSLILAYVKFQAQIFSTEDIIRQIAALIIDLTYMYLLLILIISAIRLRRMRRGLNN